jgi:hypothetical protein
MLEKNIEITRILSIREAGKEGKRKVKTEQIHRT